MIDIQRLKKDLKITQNELADVLGKSNAAISNVKKGLMDFPKEWKSIIEKKYNINIDDYELEKSQILQEEETKYVGSRNKRLGVINHDSNGKSIPYFETEVFATISPAMGDVVALRPDTFIRIPMFSQGEFALTVTGHSMKGYINHGDWIIVKRITNRDEIIYGEPHLIVTKSDNIKTVKFLKQGDTENTFWLVPYNVEQFEPQEIKKNSVLELYRVLGVFKSV